MSRISAIKVLDHAMTGNDGVDNCQKFVDILGLRSIFPVFMKTPKTSKKTTKPEEIEGTGAGRRCAEDHFSQKVFQGYHVFRRDQLILCLKMALEMNIKCVK